MENKRKDELKARCAELNESMVGLEQRVALEHEGIFTDELRQEHAGILAQFVAADTELKALEDDENRQAQRILLEERLKPKALPRKTDANSGSAIATEPQLKPIGGDDGPSKPKFTIPAVARKYGAGTLRAFKDDRDGIRADERAYRFGMWALAMMGECIPRYNFPSARQFVNNYMGGIYNTAHSESDSTTGGQFLVPEEFSSDLIILREKYGVFRRLAARETMMSDVKHIPKRASGLTAYFVGENQQATESNMTWQDIQLIAKDLTVLARMSNQLSADAAIQVGDTLAGEISYAFANKEDDCGFNGDGTSTYGGIQGVRNMLINADGANTKSASTVTAAATGAWSSLVLTDFNKVVGQLPQYADTPNACWICHRTFYGQIMQKLETAAGGNTLTTIAEGDRRPRPLFLGYPVEFSQVFPSATAATGVPVVLGDLSLGAVFADRQQTSIAFSEHATINGENVFERNQVAVRGTERFDVNVHGCKSTSVVGPIVGLALA